jgi:hypothetical protein
MRYGQALGMVFGLGLAAVQPAAAQRFSVSPTLGLYSPTTDLYNAATGQTFKQEVALSVGARLGLWFSDRVGIQATGNWVPSSLQYTLTPGGATQTGKSDLWFGSGRLTVFLIKPSSPVYLAIGGGVGVVGRSGAAYDSLGTVGVQSTSDVSGVASVGAGVHLGPLQLYATADDYIYNATLTGTSVTSSKQQNDIQLAVGLGIPLGGK